MKKKLHSRVVVSAAVAILFAISGNATFASETQSVLVETPELLSEQPEYPRIKRQPADQGVFYGQSIVFSVAAENADGYQWVRNGVVLAGQTNSTLTIEQATVEDVGLYTAYVFKGEEAVPTRMASLNVYAMSSGGGGFTVYATAISATGGQGTSCPGSYAGYANYVKPNPAWGWVPSSNTSIHTATDTNRTDTSIVWMGKYYDSGCAQTTVTVPDPPASPKYRFTVFFPDNVPTNAYALVLDGFDP